MPCSAHLLAHRFSEEPHGAFPAPRVLKPKALPGALCWAGNPGKSLNMLEELGDGDVSHVHFADKGFRKLTKLTITSVHQLRMLQQVKLLGWLCRATVSDDLSSLAL